MTKRGTLDDELDALRALRADPSAPEARDRLRRALASKKSLVVAAAAEIVGEAELSDLLPLLVPAFERFLIDPVRTDKGCRTKAAIVDALQRSGYDAPDLFLRGLRYVQREPVWGGTVDTAAGLRGRCGFGLARLDHPDALIELAELLADPERTARADAARAIACVGRPEGVPLLRFKALAGDEDPEVLTECLSALLDLSPRSLAFVGRFLGHADEAVAEAAAIALGNSRLEGAFGILKPWSDGLGAGRCRSALVAIAMLRSPPAVDYLISLIEGSSTEIAAQAVSALALYRFDASVRRRVEAAVGGLRIRPLRQALIEAFPPAERAPEQ